MANYPPPPPGGWGPPGGAPPQGGPPGYGPPGHGGYDPYAADRALAAWAADRKYELVAQPDPNFYYSWYPFAYMPRPTSVTRELRATVDDAKIFVGEAWDNDPLRQAVGEARMLLFFILSPKLRCRASVRSKQGGGLDKEIGRGLSELFGGAKPAGSILGDPTLEQRCDVTAPTRDEGNWALPMPLRQLLVQPGFKGILETRAGGMAVVLYDYAVFEPRTLDAALQLVSQLYRAAVAQPTG